MDTSSSQPTDNDERSPPARQTRSSSRRSASQTLAEAPPPVEEGNVKLNFEISLRYDMELKKKMLLQKIPE
jgi:hypothetical protein